MTDLPTPTDLLSGSATVEPRGYHFVIGFTPPIILKPKRGHEFAAELSDVIGASTSKVTDTSWNISQILGDSPRSRFAVTITDQQLQIDALFPTYPQEPFEQRNAAVLERFGTWCRPNFIVHSAAMIRATVPIQGDARIFLAEKVMHLNAEEREIFRPVFGRPVHIVGMRLQFPPFQEENKNVSADSAGWTIDVKVESLAEDPKKLYLEAHGIWHQPVVWNEQNLEQAVQHLGMVKDFMNQQVIEFLRRAGSGYNPL